MERRFLNKTKRSLNKLFGEVLFCVGRSFYIHLFHSLKSSSGIELVSRFNLARIFSPDQAKMFGLRVLAAGKQGE